MARSVNAEGAGNDPGVSLNQRSMIWNYSGTL
jgi:hypothetical protein